MLKNTLSLLLSKFYSKKESELVGHQAMPSTDNVALTPTTTSIDGWGAVCNGVAPTDGFACIKFTWMKTIHDASFIFFSQVIMLL